MNGRSANLSTLSEQDDVLTQVEASFKAINVHQSSTHAGVHAGLRTEINSPLYSDSAGDVWGTKVLKVKINGTTYYVPAKNA